MGEGGHILNTKTRRVLYRNAYTSCTVSFRKRELEIENSIFQDRFIWSYLTVSDVMVMVLHSHQINRRLWAVLPVTFCVDAFNALCFTYSVDGSSVNLLSVGNLTGDIR